MFHTLSFWINAFIPKTIPNYTITIPGGPHAAKTAIPLPLISRLEPTNARKKIFTGYLTDQRSFSADPYASVRMQSIAAVDVKAQTMQLQKYGEKNYHNTSGTTELDTSTGEVTGWLMADMTRCSFTPLTTLTPLPPFGITHPFAPTVHFPPPPQVKSSRTTITTVYTSLVGQAGDPLVALAADIDYIGVFFISLVKDLNKLLLVQVDFVGKIDAFPAFEAYASLCGVTRTLFQVPPPKGNEVDNLLGDATREIRGIAIFRQGIDF